MPFKSKAQERFMFAKHPAIAKRWVSETGQPKDLPKHVDSNALSMAREKRDASTVKPGRSGSHKGK